MTEMRRFTKEEQASFGYTVAELRELAREHQVRVPSRPLHHELVGALKAAGVELPTKRRRPGKAGLAVAGNQGRCGNPELEKGGHHHDH